MKIDFAARADTGARAENDDRVLIDGRILDGNAHSGTLELPAIAVVCDGCGGYRGGGVAAETVLQCLAEHTPEALSDAETLAQALDDCERKVAEEKLKLPHFSEMCTTVAGCVFTNGTILFFHSGDSRVYRCDRWGIAKMTRDHSTVQDMIDLGEITPEEALVHPRRNVINRCIGINCPPPEIYVSHASIQPEEKYLLCSDGLWESISDAGIKAILDSDLPLPQMIDALFDTALRQGADDNISVCICAAQGTLETVEQKPFILD